MVNRSSRFLVWLNVGRWKMDHKCVYVGNDIQSPRCFLDTWTSWRSTYISFISSVLLTLRLIDVAVYRLIDYCSVSARLIGVAYYRLIGVATDFNHRFLRDSYGFLAVSSATLTPHFPVTRLSIAFDSCQGVIFSRLSWNWFRLVTHIRFLWTLGPHVPT